MANILTVDDSASMRQMVAFTLQSAGHDVTQASDGIEALEQAKKNQYNLIITDVNMPNMDGISLTRELRALDNYKYIPILTLTTESAKSRKEEGRAAGATGWIVKPFNPEKLLSTIKKVLA